MSRREDRLDEALTEWDPLFAKVEHQAKSFRLREGILAALYCVVDRLRDCELRVKFSRAKDGLER